MEGFAVASGDCAQKKRIGWPQVLTLDGECYQKVSANLFCPNVKEAEELERVERLRRK